MTNIAHEAVVRYRTADGEEFKTEKEAQEHAENVAGDKIQLLLKGIHNMGHQMSYQLTVDMIKNAPKYMEALQGLHAFEPQPETGE